MIADLFITAIRQLSTILLHRTATVDRPSEGRANFLSRAATAIERWGDRWQRWGGRTMKDIRVPLSLSIYIYICMYNIYIYIYIYICIYIYMYISFYL